MTDSGAIQPRKGSRVPGVVLLAVATAVSVLIALLPRTGNQAPPPTVAEFAPEAAREIRQALANQSSDYGGGPSVCERGSAQCIRPTPTPTPTDPPVAPSRVVCHGPVRVGDETYFLQTEDPQSPPCIPAWNKRDNGGKTSRGVTANEIIVALPTVGFEDPKYILALADWFNLRFQFYGRKIVLKKFTTKGDLNARPNPDQELADAKIVDEQLRAFASLTTGGRYGSEHLFYDELARRKVVSIAHRTGTKTEESYLRRWAPYRWSVLPGMDIMQRHIAEMMCKVLADKQPEYAGPGVTAAKRVFGLAYVRAADGTKPNLDVFRRLVKGCGITLAADVEHSASGRTDDSTAGTTTILKMIQQGVTSIVCFCDNSEVVNSLMPAASGEQYRPEWILSTYIDSDTDNAMSQAPPDQATHVFGVSFRNKWLPRQDMFWYRAIQEAHPDLAVPANQGYSLAARYSSLLLLASGIQMAGPNLTPATFQAGLLATRFANPRAGKAPFYQARVGFDGNRHTMIADATMFWQDRSKPGTVDPASLGAVCYVRNGSRYELGEWERKDPAFFGDC